MKRASFGRHYRTFLLATAVSSFGDGLLVTGLPLLARAATKRPFLVSAVFVGSRIPWLIGLALGALADRRDAKRVMIASDIGRALLLGLLGFILITRDGPISISILIAAALLLGVGQITFFAASQRAVPAIAEHNLQNANSTFQTITTAGEQFIGPQAGALFLRGGTIPIIGDALSFAGSALLLARLPRIPPEATDKSWRASIAEGWNWFRTNRAVRLITTIMTLNAGISGAALATEVILIRDTLGKPDYWFGIFSSVLAAGALLGSLIAPRIIKTFGTATTPLAICFGGLAYLAVPGQPWPIVFVAMFIQQASTIIPLIQTLTIRQQIIPDRLRGRVISFSRSFAFSTQIIGGSLGGLITEHAGGTNTLFITAGTATIAVALLFARPFRLVVDATAQHPT